MFQGRYLGSNLESTKFTEDSSHQRPMSETKHQNMTNLKFKNFVPGIFLDDTVAQKGTWKSVFSSVQEIVSCVDDSFQIKTGTYLYAFEFP